jgi:hypothetical protein
LAASSGTTGIGTNGDAAVPVIFTPPLAGQTFRNLVVVNTGAVQGWLLIDGVPIYLPSAQSSVPGGIFFNNILINGSTLIDIQRVAGGSDLTGVFVAVA